MQNTSKQSEGGTHKIQRADEDVEEEEEGDAADNRQKDSDHALFRVLLCGWSVDGYERG